jgi:hypothetical protein
MFPRKPSRLVAAGIAAVAVAGGAYGAVNATSSGTPATTSAATGPAAFRGAGSGGSNARSGPAAGGSIGTVSGISRSGFTLVTSTGQKVTVEDTSSTTYAKGATVLAIGTVDGTTVTATEIVVQPPSGASKTASAVVPFTRGAGSAAKSVGQIPASYQQGSGTIVSGTTASKATKAALAAFPGGIVDRVVRLSNGEYEVHNIGVNWPHHIFVNQTFKVVGAD